MYYEWFRPTNAHWFHSKIERDALIFLTCPLSDQGPFSISYLESSNLANHLVSPSNPSHLIYFGTHPIVFPEMRCWRHHASASTLWASYQIRKIAGCACAGNAGNVFPHRRLQRKPLVSDPGMHHGTCVTHVPWCMSWSLTRGGGENVPGIPGACAPAVLRIWQEAHCDITR